MTMLGVPEGMNTALREGIQIDGLLFEEGREDPAILQENSPLPVYFQTVVQDLILVLESMA